MPMSASALLASHAFLPCCAASCGCAGRADMGRADTGRTDAGACVTPFDAVCCDGTAGSPVDVGAGDVVCEPARMEKQTWKVASHGDCPGRQSTVHLQFAKERDNNS
eukprot:5104262-Pleurochrysis_carterae.AAC.1